MIPDICKRIATLIEESKLSANAFGQSIQASSSRISNIVTGRNRPDFDLLEGIFRQYRNVSRDWLILGEGNIRLDKTKALTDLPTISKEGKSEPLVITLDHTGNDNIAFVDTKAAAGYPVKLVEPEFYRELPAFSLPGGEFRNGLFRCFEVSGDSMADTLYHGDWVICRYLDGGIYDIREGYIHVVVTTDQVLVKRVLNRTAKSHKLILQSDNQAYGLYSVTDTDVRELWLVKSKLSFNLPNRNKDIVKTMTELQVKLHDVEERLAEVESKSKNKK